MKVMYEEQSKIQNKDRVVVVETNLESRVKKLNLSKEIIIKASNKERKKERNTYINQIKIKQSKNGVQINLIKDRKQFNIYALKKKIICTFLYIFIFFT